MKDYSNLDLDNFLRNINRIKQDYMLALEKDIREERNPFLVATVGDRPVKINGEGQTNTTWNETLMELLAQMNDDTLSDTVNLYIKNTIGSANINPSPYGIVIDTPTINSTPTAGFTGYGIKISAQANGGGIANAIGILIDSHDSEGSLSRAININGRGIQNGIAFSPGYLYAKNDLTERLAFGSFTLEEILSGVIFTQTANQTVVNTVTETTLIGTGVGTVTLPANFLKSAFGTAGRTIRITARGIYGTDLVAPTLNIRVKLGSTTVVSTGVITTAANLTNKFWEATAYITCRTSGATGTVMGNGAFLHDDALANNTLSIWGMTNTGTTTINTTEAQAIDVTAEWGTADADNTITCQILTLEVLN